ncbi:hypothetical protein PhCBS80983_g03751 [Powellomyces hirtus]|uniref:NADH dehydrogenase [ubiquinone] 1 alpha subcomplex assembly factor 3 n=1 Tax=Powellomyces hirtus TaxID=109895 RepID=A0A507E3A5_9FUNG|nr:hypothetical protein PhCBS80983_g03751 [Powellomyces hirtus]
MASTIPRFSRTAFNGSFGRLLLPRLTRGIVPTLGASRHISTSPEVIPRPGRLETCNIFPSSSAEPASSKLFTAVGNTGFTIGDMRMQGPVVVVNDAILMWDVPQFGVGSEQVVSQGANEDASGGTIVEKGDPASPFYGWDTDCFKIFEVVENVPDILVIGTGAQTYPLPPHLKTYLHKLGMQVEVLASRQAGSTYNILVQEGRRPAAALLPVIPTSARTGEVLVKFKQPPRNQDDDE